MRFFVFLLLHPFLLLALATPQSVLGSEPEEPQCEELLEEGAQDETRTPAEKVALKNELRQFFNFVDKRLLDLMDADQRLRYDYLKLQSEELLDLGILRHLPAVVKKQKTIGSHGALKNKFVYQTNAFIEDWYLEAAVFRIQWIVLSIFEREFGEKGKPSLKRLTQWLIHDLPVLNASGQIRIIFYAVLGLRADFDLPEGSPLEKFPEELITLLDHPEFQSWMANPEYFPWLEFPDEEIRSEIKEDERQRVAEQILPIVVALSRTAAGRRISEFFTSSPLFEGEDTALAIEWLRIHRERNFNEQAFLTLAKIRQKLDEASADAMVRSFFTSDIALEDEATKQMREYALHQMPMDTAEAKVQRSWVWVAAYDFARDMFHPTLISEGIFEDDASIVKTSSLAFINRAVMNGEPIETPYFKRLFETLPKMFLDRRGQTIALQSLQSRDLPWLLQQGNKVPLSLQAQFLEKSTLQILAVPTGQVLPKIRWEPVELESLVSAIDKTSSPELVANSAYWLAQTIRMKPSHILRVFDWLIRSGQKHRLAPKVKAALIGNIGFRRLLDALSKDLSFERLRGFDQTFADLIGESDNAEKFIATLVSRADEMVDSQKLVFLDFISTVIEKYGAWPKVISELSSSEVKDYATYVTASAVYLSKETGSRGLRNAQTRALFEEGIVLGHPFALLVPQKTHDRSRRETASPAQAPQKAVEPSKPLPESTGYNNPDSVTPEKSTAALLAVLKNTQRNYVGLAAVNVILERNQKALQDFGTPADFSKLLDLAKWQLAARNHAEVADRLFHLVMFIIEQQFLFELDDALFKSWSDYYAAYASQRPMDALVAEAFFRWFESVSAAEAARLLTVLQAPTAVALSAPPTEAYLNYLSSWFQAKARTEHPGYKGFAAAIVAPAFMSPDLSADIQRAAFHWRGQARPEIYDLLISLKAPALYPLHKLVVKGHAHFSFSRLKSEAGLLKHAGKIRADKKELIARHGPKLPAAHEEKQKQLNEELAIVATLLHELKHGRMPWEVDGFTELGYDILSLDPLTGEVRRIEVKSGYGETNVAYISNNELKVCAATQTEGAYHYYFYLIDTRRALTPAEPLAAIKLIKNPVVLELRPHPQLDDSVPRERLLRFAVQE